MTWLTNLLDRLLSIFPRIVIVAPDEAGVRVTPSFIKGVRVKDMTPGWWLVWPVIQQIDVIKVKTQIVDLRPQSVWTSDGKELVVSGSIKYRVDSAVKAVLDVFDYDANIRNLTLGIIFDFVNGKSLEKLDLVQLKDEILKGLREASRGWGLKIETVYLTDIGRVRNIRLLMNETPR